MVDDVVFEITRKGLQEGDFEYGDRRCHLSEGLIERLLARLYTSVRGGEIDGLVSMFRESLLNNRPFSLPEQGRDQ
jgi:hypothetical protein